MCIFPFSLSLSLTYISHLFADCCATIIFITADYCCLFFYLPPPPSQLVLLQLFQFCCYLKRLTPTHTATVVCSTEEPKVSWFSCFHFILSFSFTPLTNWNKNLNQKRISYFCGKKILRLLRHKVQWKVSDFLFLVYKS